MLTRTSAVNSVSNSSANSPSQKASNWDKAWGVLRVALPILAFGLVGGAFHLTGYEVGRDDFVSTGYLFYGAAAFLAFSMICVKGAEAYRSRELNRLHEAFQQEVEPHQVFIKGEKVTHSEKATAIRKWIEEQSDEDQTSIEPLLRGFTQSEWGQDFSSERLDAGDIRYVLVAKHEESGLCINLKESDGQSFIEVSACYELFSISNNKTTGCYKLATMKISPTGAKGQISLSEPLTF